MATIIFIMMLLAMWHFVYDAVLLPSFRRDLRYKFFKIRDKLRMAKIESGDEISDELFNDLSHSINISIHYLPYLSISLFISILKEINRNENLKKKVENKIRLIEGCQNKSIREISALNGKYTLTAYSLNSGAWFIYLVPIIIIGIIIILLDRFKTWCIKKSKKYIQRISYIPEYEFLKFIPNYELQVA